MMVESCWACGCHEMAVMSVETAFGWKTYCRKHGERRIRVEKANKLLVEMKNG